MKKFHIFFYKCVRTNDPPRRHSTIIYWKEKMKYYLMTIIEMRFITITRNEFEMPKNDHKENGILLVVG